MTGRIEGSRNQRMHRWTDEQYAYLSKIVSGRSHREIHALVTERFGIELTVEQVKAAISRKKLNTGRTGHFVKGQISHNKGKKGVCAPGCEKGWFAKGGYAHNRVQIGTERISKDGYIEVKYRDGYGVRNWRSKQSLLWEAENGPIPAGHAVMLKDGDKTNCTLDNLMLVSRADLARFNHIGLPQGPGGITEAGVLVARMHNTIAKRRRTA